MKNKIIRDLPIEPGIGIGNIKLLQNAVHLRSLILNELDTISPNTNEQGDWVCNFEFPDWVHFSYKNMLKVDVNIYSGLIVRIEVTDGYKGLLWNTIRIGSTVAELIAIQPEAYPDEEIIIVGDDFGIQFTIDREGDIWDLEEVKENKIVKIAICAHEFQSLPFSAGELPQSWIGIIDKAIQKSA